MIKFKCTNKVRNIIIIGIVIALLVAIICVGVYRNNNYNGSDINKYTGTWRMIEIWQNGYQINTGANGFSNIYITIKKDGTCTYDDKDHNNKSSSKAEVSKGLIYFDLDDEYRYTIEKRKGYLFMVEKSLKNTDEPELQWILEKSK